MYRNVASQSTRPRFNAPKGTDSSKNFNRNDIWSKRKYNQG